MRTTPTHTRWRIVGLVFVIYVLMFIDRVNTSIAAKYIMPEYGLTDVEFGWIFSAFVLGYALVQIPGGWLGDRFGPRRVLTRVIVWWSVFTALTALAGELFLTSLVGVVGSFAVVRVLIGLGEAAAPPNGNLGGAISPTLTPFLAQSMGWEGALYTTAALAVCGAFFWLWVHPEHEIDLEGVPSKQLPVTRTMGVEAAE